MELQTIIWKEGKLYVIKEMMTGVTTQGKTIEDAIKNMKEAISLYLEEMPQVRRELRSIKKVGAISVEIA